MKELTGLTREDAEILTKLIKALVPDALITPKNCTGTRYLEVLHGCDSYSVQDAEQAVAAIELFGGFEDNS